MREIVIVFPEIEMEQNFEIEVRINGRKKTLHYRVELLNWEGTKHKVGERFTVLKHCTDGYDKNRELVEIGTPGNITCLSCSESAVKLQFSHKNNPYCLRCCSNMYLR